MDTCLNIFTFVGLLNNVIFQEQAIVYLWNASCFVSGVETRKTDILVPSPLHQIHSSVRCTGEASYSNTKNQ